MTRRKFLDGIFRIGSTAVVMGLSGVRWLAGKTLPRRFVQAVRMNKYPGSIRELGEINERSKWSG
jgi:hypothetical protein